MNRGEFVQVDWPFSDRTGSKTRPAVVVQADFLNGLIDDTVLVQITGTRHGLPLPLCSQRTASCNPTGSPAGLSLALQRRAIGSNTAPVRNRRL